MADSDILRGAQQRAAGETLGLTQDEVLELKRRQIQQRSEDFQARRAERAGNQQEAEEFLRDDSRRFETKGRFEEQERYPDPFGIPVSAADPEPFSKAELKEMNRADFQRERGEYVIVDRGRGKEKMWRERGQLVSDPKFAKNKKEDMSDPFVKPPNAPQGAGFGGPNGLATKLADMVVRGEISENDLIPNGNGKTVGMLMQEMALEADPQLRVEADRAIGRQTAQRDAERFTPAARALVDARAEREALGYIANTAGYTGDIETIQTLGLASKKFNRGVPMDKFNVVQAVDPNTFTDAIEMIGPNGETVGYNDGNDRFVADANFAEGSAANAPVSRTATWMEGNLPSFGREGGANFGPRSINPGDELSLLSQRLGNFAPATGIRGIDDLERAVRSVTVDAAFSGRTMWNFDPTTGKKNAVQDPGLEEVLQGLDYTADEKVRLAAALQSVEAAQRSPVNRLQKDMYAAGLTPQGNANYAANLPKQGNVVSTGFEKDVQLARITNERVGRDNKKTGEKRTSVRKGLRELDASPERVFDDRDPNTIYTTAEDGSRVMLPEAQQDLTDAIAAQGDSNKPFQAAPAGEQPERARFLGKGIYKLTDQERLDRFGGAGGEAANEVLRRAKEDRVLREAAKKQPDSRASLMRQKDQEFKVAGDARNAADNAREVNEAFERMGLPLEGKGQMLLGGQIVPDSRTELVPDRNVVPQGPLQPGMTSDERKVYEFQEKIARQRGKATSAVTNPATDPTPLTDRGGWMGGGSNGRVVNPMASPEPERTPLSGATPDGPGTLRTPNRKQVRAEAGYRKMRRYGRNAAIAGGASAGIAGISALIGGERDRREQEAI